MAIDNPNIENTLEKESIYMDSGKGLSPTLNLRIPLYKDVDENSLFWRYGVPVTKAYRDEIVLLLKNGVHEYELMGSYQEPYMKKLAEIVTRNGGNILNIGYGLGIIDNEIEKKRKTGSIQKHFVIEINNHIANKAREKADLIVFSGSYKERIKDIPDNTLDAVVYDGFPLSEKDIHRDGVTFLKVVAESGKLKKGAIITFFADVCGEFSKEFISYITELGFDFENLEQVKITPPDRIRPNWKLDVMYAPTLIFRGRTPQ